MNELQWELFKERSQSLELDVRNLMFHNFCNHIWDQTLIPFLIEDLTKTHSIEAAFTFLANSISQLSEKKTSIRSLGNFRDQTSQEVRWWKGSWDKWYQNSLWDFELLLDLSNKSRELSSKLQNWSFVNWSVVNSVGCLQECLCIRVFLSGCLDVWVWVQGTWVHYHNTCVYQHCHVEEVQYVQWTYCCWSACVSTFLHVCVCLSVVQCFQRKYFLPRHMRISAMAMLRMYMLVVVCMGAWVTITTSTSRLPRIPTCWNVLKFTFSEVEIGQHHHF